MQRRTDSPHAPPKPAQIMRKGLHPGPFLCCRVRCLRHAERRALNSRGTQPEKTRKQQKLPHKQGGVAVQQGRCAHKACSGTQEKPAPRQQSEKLNSSSQGQHEAPCPKKGAVRRQPDHRLARRHNAQAAIRGGKHAFSRQNSHAARHSLVPHQRAPLAVQHTPGPGQALGSVGCFHTVGLNFQQP